MPISNEKWVGEAMANAVLDTNTAAAGNIEAHKNLMALAHADSLYVNQHLDANMIEYIYKRGKFEITEHIPYDILIVSILPETVEAYVAKEVCKALDRAEIRKQRRKDEKRKINA
jgi:hypothetical protein